MDPKIRRLRGTCGGPFDVALTDIYSVNDVPDDSGGTRKEGAWIEDGRVVISADTACSRLSSEGTFRSCPVAATAQEWYQRDVCRSYVAYDRGQLVLIQPAPSAALLDALQATASAMADVDKYEMEIRKS